jgi:hypothetical protein
VDFLIDGQMIHDHFIIFIGLNRSESGDRASQYSISILYHLIQSLDHSPVFSEATDNA